MTSDDWVEHADGLILGDLGVFPATLNAWTVWAKIDDEWHEVEPLIAASSSGRTHSPGANPPWEFWERSRDETIAEAKRLALLYRDGQAKKKPAEAGASAGK